MVRSDIQVEICNDEDVTVYISFKSGNKYLKI